MQIINHRSLFYQGARVRVKDPSAEARRRLDILEKYQSLRRHGYTEEAALAFLSVRRSTFYEWRRRYRRTGLSGLEPRSRRPRNVRRSQIAAHTRQRVCHLRKQFPMWGRDKIAILLRREGHAVSPATVGRLLRKLIERNVIKPVPVLKAERLRRRRRHWRKHARRWLYGMKGKAPGELIQIDHMSVNTSSNVAIKHFQATCPVTKITVAEAYAKADSATAALFLAKVIRDMPFPVLSVQVDGGSEFMKNFEEACEKNSIPLFVLPPRSPKYNGTVERTNGTFRYEFYQACDLGYSLPEIRKDLESFVKIYNGVRPHEALDYLTPSEYYDQQWAAGSTKKSSML